MKYKFEWNDLRAIITLLNVLLVVTFGLSVIWITLGIAVLGLVNDFTTTKKVNGFVIHGLNFVLNLYLLINYA